MSLGVSRKRPEYDMAPVLSYSELFANNVQERLKPRDWIRQVIYQLEGRPINCPGAQPDHVPRGASSVGRWTAIKTTRRNKMPLPRGFYSENRTPKCLRGVTIDVKLPQRLMRFPELDLISPWWLSEDEYMAWWDLEESLDWDYIVTTSCPVLESPKMNVYTHTLIRPVPVEPLKSRATVLSCKQTHATIGARGERPIKKQMSDAELLVHMYPDLYYIPKDPTPYMSRFIRTVPPFESKMKAPPKPKIRLESKMKTQPEPMPLAISTIKIPEKPMPLARSIIRGPASAKTPTRINKQPEMTPPTKTKVTQPAITRSSTHKSMTPPSPRSCQISKVPLRAC